MALLTMQFVSSKGHVQCTEGLGDEEEEEEEFIKPQHKTLL